MLYFLGRGSRIAVLLRACVTIALIALADWRIEESLPLGFLYLFPMLLVGSVLNRWQIGIAATICTLLTENFDSFEFFARSGIPRDILIFAVFYCAGLFVHEVGRSRREIEREAEARREAEEQLKILVESSPAAVFTASSRGEILLANEAAHRLFGVPAGNLTGRSIHQFIPSLLNVPNAESGSPFRTAMQCRGQRLTGEVFLADVWFSTYRTSAGPRLAAMVVDTSEDLRNREELSLNQLLAGSRILVGAVSHEIRNVCGAIAMAHANLSRGGALGENKDFEALGSLIGALEKIAAMELRHTSAHAGSVDLASLLQELRIVAEPSLEERDVALIWEVDPGVPAVLADRQSLMQVFLNLTRNSERAMEDAPVRRFTISTHVHHGRVTVSFRDTGCGVAYPDRLFKPFQQDARSAGLGLYLSRAFMRSFRGELRYQPEADGSSFLVELSAIGDPNEYITNESDSHSVGGRSQSLPREPEPLAPGRA